NALLLFRLLPSGPPLPWQLPAPGTPPFTKQQRSSGTPHRCCSPSSSSARIRRSWGFDYSQGGGRGGDGEVRGAAGHGGAHRRAVPLPLPADGADVLPPAAAVVVLVLVLLRRRLGRRRLRQQDAAARRRNRGDHPLRRRLEV
uniref:Uncharacterized protein n=1 Tax=Oryza brachyantha TaxID=4533 RepID=J3MJ32_ORYBR